MPNLVSDMEAFTSGSKYVQYAKQEGSFVPNFATVQSLPVGVYNPAQYYTGKEWTFGLRPIDWKVDTLLTFEDGQGTRMVQDVEEFWKWNADYKKLGLLHKRGWLLVGSAGVGKTTIVNQVVQNSIARGGVVWYVTKIDALMNLLPKFRSIEPEREIVVVLEDLEELIHEPGGEASLLSLLDGELQIERVVFIATSNYPESLDRRFSGRPGRLDFCIDIKMPTKKMREQYLNFKVGTTQKDGIDLVERTEGFSLAHLRELIVSVFIAKKDVEETIERLKKMKHVPKNPDTGEHGFQSEGGQECPM